MSKARYRWVRAGLLFRTSPRERFGVEALTSRWLLSKVLSPVLLGGRATLSPSPTLCFKRLNPEAF